MKHSWTPDVSLHMPNVSCDDERPVVSSYCRLCQRVLNGPDRGEAQTWRDLTQLACKCLSPDQHGLTQLDHKCWSPDLMWPDTAWPAGVEVPTVCHIVMVQTYFPPRTSWTSSLRSVLFPLCFQYQWCYYLTFYWKTHLSSLHLFRFKAHEGGWDFGGGWSCWFSNFCAVWNAKKVKVALKQHYVVSEP